MAPLALTGFLPAWDIERRRADLRPIIGWTLARLRRLGHQVQRLEDLHHHMDAERARALGQELTAASLCRDLRAALQQALIEALPEVPLARVWRQTYAHFRVLVPEDQVAPVPPHTDFGFGHSLSERNLWLALTDAQGGGALHVLPLRDSLSFLGRIGAQYGVVEGAPEIPPVPARSGEILLFTPLHLHRARPASAQSRVSIDLRIVPAPSARADFTFSPILRAT